MPKRLGQIGANVSRDPGVCLDCWDNWLMGPRKRKDMPKPLNRHQTWQERVEIINLADRVSRLAVVVITVRCFEHAKVRADGLKGRLGTQEAML